MGGWRSSYLGVLDLHQVANFPEHTRELRALLVLGGAADLAEAERPQRAAVLLALADLATRLGYPNLRHRSFPRPASPSRAPAPRSAPAPPLPRPLASSAPAGPARPSARGSARRPRAGGAS